MSLRAVERQNRLWATLILLIPAALQLFPILYVVSLSLKSPNEIFRSPPALIPDGLHFENYVVALGSAPLGRFLFNSMLVSGLITVLQTITALLAAYALARIEFRGKALILAVILATMMVPGEITVIPNYLALARLGWIDTYRGLIIPFSASGFGVFLLYQFIRTIPKELEEAARLDGASRLRFLVRFVIPLSAPAIFAFAVYSFVSAWNQYLWPLVITQSTRMQTVQIGIGMFRSANESNSWGVIMAATVMLISPTLLIFIATQRQFVRGITMGGMKG